MSKNHSSEEKSNVIRHFAESGRAFDIRVQTCAICRLSFWDYTDTNSSQWVFYHNSEGEAVVEAGGREFVLDSRSALLIPPHTKFSSRKVSRQITHFYAHFHAPELFDNVRREVFAFGSAAVREPLSRLLAAPNDTIFALALRVILYSHLLKIPGDAFLSTETPSLDPRIRRALELMDKNPAAAPKNSELCRRAGMGINLFHRLFKSETGMTPKRYLMTRRLETARELLLHSGHSIDEIAVEVGFSDRFHFSKAFRAHCSVTPSAYRRQALSASRRR